MYPTVDNWMFEEMKTLEYRIQKEINKRFEEGYNEGREERTLAESAMLLDEAQWFLREGHVVEADHWLNTARKTFKKVELLP